MLHQGHTGLGADQPRASQSAANAPFNPETLHPKLFELGDHAWLGHLEREGYAAVRNVLKKEDAKKALRHLLDDIRSFSPSAKHASHLGQVSKADFPPSMNGTLPSLGLPHGSFAWFVRSHARIHKAFGMLFPGELLTGSVDLLFISPTGGARCDQRATSATHEQWLHVDQNQHQVCGDLPMYQGMLSLFSTETLSWPRISVPVCMAPRDHRDVAGINGEKSLLAMCIAGTASTHWPQLGVRHSQGRLTLGMVVHGVAKKFKQLAVRFHPDVPAKKAKLLRQLTATQLCHKFSIDELRSFVHPQALKYISTGVRPD